MQVHLAKTDITTMAVDAVVNPANSLGIMGGGVAGALSRRGGPSIQREASGRAVDARRAARAERPARTACAAAAA